MRRSFLLPLAALLLTLPSGFILRGGGSISTPTGVVSTQSFFNANGTTVSGPIPVMSGVWFPPGAVPAGSHAVPSIGGTTLTQWELVSEASTWPDGSFRGGSFSGFLPSALSAGTRQGITWNVVSGAVPSITPANPNVVSTNSNFHVDLTDVSGAYWLANNGGSNQTVYALIGPVVTPGSGTVSAVQVRYPTSFGFGCGGTSTTCGGYTQSISGCSVAPTFSFTSPGTGVNPVTGAVVTSGGSGCPTIGSGTFTFNVNAIIAGVGSSVPLCSNQTVNSQVCQYSGSNVKDAFKVWGYFLDAGNPAWGTSTAYTSGQVVNANGNSYKAGANCTSAASGIGPVGLSTWSTYPNIVPIVDGSCSWTPVIGKETGTAEVEVWKTSGGGVYGLNVSVLIDNAVYVANGSLSPWSFNVDLYDGALDIRGSANDPGYIGVTQYSDASGTCLCDTQSLPFWDIGGSVSQSTTLNQVIVSPSTSDRTYWHANHALPPLQTVPTINVNTTLPRNNPAHLQNMAFDASIPVPFCACDLDTVDGLGGAGSHGWDSAVSDAYGAWWQVENTVSDGGWSWLISIRNGGVATQTAYGGPREPLTGHPPNWIPAAAWTAPTNFTDPVRPFAEFYCSSSAFDMQCNGAQSGLTGNASHYPGAEAGTDYIIEGRRYMFDIMVRNAIADDLNNGLQYDRTGVFGGTTYYTEANSNEIRTTSWYQYAISWAAVFANKESEGVYYAKQMNDGFAEQHALYSFVGNGTTGWGNNAFNKCSDWTASGYEMFPHALIGGTCGSVVSGGNPGGSSWFMSGYQSYVLEMNTMWLNGSNADLAAIDSLYIGTAMIPISENCLYLSTPYTIPWLTNVYNQTAVTGWDNTTVNAAAGELPNMYQRNGNLLAWTAGNSTFTVAVTPDVSENWTTYPTAAASGTTLTLHDSVGVTGGQIYDITTPTNVPVDTYITGSAPASSLTINQAVTIPAPVTTTVTVAPTGSGTTLQVASVAGIAAASGNNVGSVVVDLTNPGALPANSTGRPQSNTTVNAITGGTTLSFSHGGGGVTFSCPSNPCPALGDTLQFSDLLTFSWRMDYPDVAFGVGVGTPLATGSRVCLANFSAAGEFVPGPNVGVYPPTTSAGGTLTEGQCFIWTQVGASGTAGTLTTLSTATPPNTVVVPSSTGSGAFGFRPNAACPSPTIGTLQSGSTDYHNDGARLAEAFGWANFAAALGINPTGAAAAITNLNQSQTPLNTVYGPSAGGNQEQKWLLDDSY